MADKVTDSILKSIRDAIGLPEEDSSFDVDLLMHINTYLGTLTQVGTGDPSVIVSDDSTTWEQFLLPEMNTPSIFQAAKTYVLINTKMAFDPPTPTSQQYMKQASDEILWRLTIAENEVIRRKEEDLDGG